MCRIIVKLAASVLAFAVQVPAFAQERACLMEGSFTLFGQKTEIKDCLQNNGVPKEQFLESCKGLANAAAALGAPPAKITYMATCPAQAQATCQGFFGAQMTAYYYKRDAQTLADSKKGCIAQGGKWSGS